MAEIQSPKIVGKIDLDNPAKKVKPQEEKPQPKKEVVVEKVIEKPIETAPVAEETIRIEYRNYTATIYGVDNPANIQLYALGGKRITAATHGDGSAITVSLSSLAPGIYILDIDGKQSFKLLKR